MAKQIVAPSPAKIKVIGIGGGGCNAINRMVDEGILGVDFVAMNTDAQSLQLCQSPVKFQLGEKLTRGLGVGGDHRLGERAAEESREELREIVHGADMLFITAGMGGGTGTGAAPVVAQLAKEGGALTIAVVTKPFSFEGIHRRLVAEEGINKLMEYVDTLIIVPNDRLLTICDVKTGVNKAFKLADEVLFHGVQAIAEVITVPGLINLDFADIKSVMKDAGPAWLAIGRGTGQNRATDAAKAALASPLLDVSIEGAKGVLYTITGGQSLSLHEINEAANIITKAVDAEANIIFGVAYDEEMNNEVKITLIATGFRTKGGITPPKPEEVKQLLQAVGEEELDVPAFLRHPLTLRRQQMIHRASQLQTTTSH
jgi:cell division protein FtsZ